MNRKSILNRNITNILFTNDSSHLSGLDKWDVINTASAIALFDLIATKDCLQLWTALDQNCIEIDADVNGKIVVYSKSISICERFHKLILASIADEYKNLITADFQPRLESDYYDHY